MISNLNPNNILGVYKNLVSDYISLLYSDYSIIKGKWILGYYDQDYLDLINNCNDFINSNYNLIAPFDYAYNLYNNMSKFFKDYKNNINNIILTKELISVNLMVVTLELEIIKTIFR